MTSHNPAQHARVAADALDRLLYEVRTGRAAWAPHTLPPAVTDLARLAESLAATAQQAAAALDPAAPTTPRSSAALRMAGQAATTVAAQLRQAQRALPRH
ncbi:hypothetical protein [Streptomyces sp. NPDC089919]|uniref:hypothetical protein n=1 Tax=Streptomyces sp. NPDC089919 TaxID=3155188 RepID=UPI00342E95F7